MAISRQVDLLEPINLADHLGKVELYLGQVCQIAGISKMQLDYWTNKAQIPTKGKKQRIYDIDALETVMLIKQAKDKGLNLGAAIEAARRFREENEVPASAAARRAPELAQRRRGVLGRERIDPPAGAELDAGENREARDDLDVPVRGVVEPRVERHGAGRAVHAARRRRRGAPAPRGAARRRMRPSRGSAGAITSS